MKNEAHLHISTADSLNLREVSKTIVDYVASCGLTVDPICNGGDSYDAHITGIKAGRDSAALRKLLTDLIVGLDLHCVKLTGEFVPLKEKLGL